MGGWSEGGEWGLYCKKADVLGLCNISLIQAKIASGYIEQPFSTVF